jgi:hypothetical protein
LTANTVGGAQEGTGAWMWPPLLVLLVLLVVLLVVLVVLVEEVLPPLPPLPGVLTLLPHPTATAVPRARAR